MGFSSSPCFFIFFLFFLLSLAKAFGRYVLRGWLGYQGMGKFGGGFALNTAPDKGTIGWLRRWGADEGSRPGLLCTVCTTTGPLRVHSAGGATIAAFPGLSWPISIHAGGSFGS